MASDPHHKIARDGFGLMAIGSSDAWEVTIDESLDDDHEWEAEIEGPNIYISFSLKDLRVFRDALDYLQTRIMRKEDLLPSGSMTQDGLTLGKFGASRILLIWDNEDFDRCFLVIGATGHSTVRFNLSGDEIRAFAKALEKVVGQLPHDL